MSQFFLLITYGLISFIPNLPQFLSGQTYFHNTALISSVSPGENEREFAKIKEKAIAKNFSQLPFSEIMQDLADQFLGQNYQAGLLDRSQREEMFVSFTKFDCLIFVETVLALARGIAVQDYNYNTFVEHLQQQRYRHGELVNYCSRLHYFSEWIEDNQRRGIVQNITPYIGGIPLKKTLNFMSKNRQSYPQLKDNEYNYRCILEVEKSLTTVKKFYIPKERTGNIYPHLKAGDIIAVTTNIEGLDVTHTGLVYRQGQAVGLIHASPGGKVTIAPDLQRYVSRVPRSTGIMVVRPLDPRSNLNR